MGEPLNPAAFIGALAVAIYPGQPLLLPTTSTSASHLWPSSSPPSSVSAVCAQFVYEVLRSWGKQHPDNDIYDA